MQHTALSSPSKADFLSFFRDQDKVKTLTREEKAEIARHILLEHTRLTRGELEEIWNDYSQAIHQLVEQRNSLPVF